MTHPPPLCTVVPRLTPKEIAVASMVAKRWIVKRIATELHMSESRVYVHLASVAFKLGVPCDQDDRQYVGDWWRAQVPITDDTQAA